MTHIAIDWLIIGGGVHGTHVALMLLRTAGVPRGQLRILDPHRELLARWRACTRNTGMTTLRSPGVHQLDAEPRALFAFAKSSAGRDLPQPRGSYGRPTLAMFDAHCASIIQRDALDELHTPGSARSLRRAGGAWVVGTDCGAIAARNVVIAIGAGDQPAWPAWAAALRDAGGPVYHIFEAGFARAPLAPSAHAVVIGGGISAAQTALALAALAPGQVTLLQRHPQRSAMFDSDPCWMGPRCMEGFAREGDLRRRRMIITEARARGALPDYVAQQLGHAAREGRVLQRFGAAIAGACRADGSVALTTADGATLSADCVVLATGFAPDRPGGAWLDHAVTAEALPVAPCGYPIVDACLRWAPGLFVTGPLAELELGPTSRNIVGARHAARRVVMSVLGHGQEHKDHLV